MVEYQDDLNKLELLSVEISDLVNTNNFEKILKLDLERQKIINKISNTVPLSSKNKITEIEKEIGNLTQAGSAYWDKNNPNHGAAVEEVLALREKKNQV